MHVESKGGKRNLVLIISGMPTVVLNSKQQKRLERKSASICSGGNVLLERGKIVTLQDYKKIKRKVMTHAF